MKKVISLFLSLMMLLSLTAGLDFSAYATDLSSSGLCGNNVTYTFYSSTGILTINGRGAMIDYTSSYDSPFYKQSSIKEVVINSGVTSIGNRAFFGCTGLTSITIPDSVTSIGYSAFEGCTGLTSITIPNSVTRIVYSAFQNCSSLTSITIPDSVTSIGESAFYECTSLTSVTIGNGLTSIGNRAFSYCTGLTSITIPDSLTSIDDLAFSNTAYYNDENNWENGVLYIGNHLIKTKYTISGSYSIKAGTKTIANSAFDLCKKLTSITVPDSVTSIGNCAFLGCSGLTSITIPDSVTSIGESAFQACTSLTSVTIGNGLTSIDDSAFEHCRSLTSITIPDGIISIGYYAFFDCSSLTDVYYSGSEEQWQAINIDSENNNNENLINATVHYNSSGPVNIEREPFTFGKHSNNFNHINTNGKYDGFKNVVDYSVPRSYLDELTLNMNAVSKKLFMLKHVNKTWGGSCYGIAATMGLAYKNKFPVVNNSKDKTYFSMGLPCDNKSFLNNIQFYYLTQYIDDYEKYSKTYFEPSFFNYFNHVLESSDYDTLSELFDDLFKMIDSDGVAQFSYKPSFGGGHSILAYKYTKNSDKSYTVELCDCNAFNSPSDLGEPVIMHVSSDKKSFSFKDALKDEINQDNYSYLKIMDVDNYEIARATSASAVASGVSNEVKIVVSDFNSFKITDKSGKTLSYTNGKFSSDMEVKDFSANIGTGKESEYVITLPASDAMDLVFEPQDGKGDISVYNDENCVAVEANNLTSANIDLDKGVEIEGTNCTFNASLGDSKTDDGIYSINATQDEKTVLNFSDNGITVDSTEALKNVQVDYTDINGIEKRISKDKTNNLSIETNTIKTGNQVLYCNHNYGNNLQYCTICGAENPNYVAPTKPVVNPIKQITQTTKTTPTTPVVKVTKPSKVKSFKVKKGKKSFTATWKPVANVEGYEIQYSLKKNMKKAKTKSVASSKKKLKVKKLKAKKKYYVRIRAYKVINGKKQYSAWSAKKKVKTK